MKLGNKTEQEIDEFRSGFFGYCKEAGFNDIDTANIVATAALLGGDIAVALRKGIDDEEGSEHRSVAG